MRTLAVVLAIVVLAMLAWTGLQASHVAIFVNGQKLVWPVWTHGIAAEGWALLVAVVGLSCVAILLAFVFAGIGLVSLGALMVGGLFAAWLAFPFLLPLLLPLFAVWAFVAILRRGGRARA